MGRHGMGDEGGLGMRGHIEQLPSGAWRVSVPLGKDPTTGKYRRSMRTVQGKRDDARRELTTMLHELDTGNYVEPAKATVGEFLDRWLRDYAAAVIDKPKTRVYYRTIVK